jgi:hypothetical protein
MMATAVWTVLAIGAMTGMFVACILAVTVGVRLLENRLARRRQNPSG